MECSGYIFGTGSFRGRHMVEQEVILNKISESFLEDYSSVCYVDAFSNEYYWYSVDKITHSLKLEQSGEDFFNDLVSDRKESVCEEDRPVLIENLQKDKLFAALKEGNGLRIEFRMMIDGEPVRHALQAVYGLNETSAYFILGVINIDGKDYRLEMEKESAYRQEAYEQITKSLVEQYDTIIYINIEDGSFIEVVSADSYKRHNVPQSGNDFFTVSRRALKKIIHPEDLDEVLNLHYKDAMLKNLEATGTFTTDFRLVINGEVKHVRHTELMSSDNKHIILCMKNINNEVMVNEELSELRQKNITFSQIAENLASHYDLIFYVNVQSNHYYEFTAHKIYEKLEVSEEGEDFFGDGERFADMTIHPEDRGRIQVFASKDNFISRLEKSRQLIEDFRVIVGGVTRYARMSVSWSGDKTHFIICIENRDDAVKKEKEYLNALAVANEAAKKDDLTGTRNKNAFIEYEKELQTEVEEGQCDRFAICICDLNDLKLVNDTQGHKEGDEYIKNACRLICQRFSHSPVFRVGGDEFAVILKEQAYEERESLVDSFKRQVEEYLRTDTGPIIALGMSEFEAGKGMSFEEAFRRADADMYTDKSRLKQLKLLRVNRTNVDLSEIKTIPEDRRRKLDILFKSYEVVSEGAYVYVCDMKYDLSRWSKTCVDIYGLPSEYMYGASDIWENHIHPDDRTAFRHGIDEIFSGYSSGHDMQYRAQKANGNYDVCTCRGVVIREITGEPEYFVGTIRSHGSQGHVDALTGIRNQYGFFEDLESWIKRKASAIVLIVGISKFVEINTVYGYNFGNRILQLYARKVFEATGGIGACYRIDGTKFAIISNTLTMDELRKKYDEFRNYFREGFRVDGKRIMLEVNCGALKLDKFDFDAQAIYSCLNFAYTQSKSRHQGEMVVFRNDFNENNRHRIEKLNAIRGSIMRGYRGFYLMYQPVVDAKSENLVSAEALLRWKNDEYGLVPPDQFIPLLESDPLFPELGAWIIREAIFAAKKMLQRVPTFVMNINLSYTQLEKSDFVDTVFGILDETGYPPEHLCFEVTERCRLLDIKLLRNVIAQLKARGVLIALDDFGTGFSSIGIVKELPFDIIKIDRKFVDKIEEDNDERELIRNFAGLASLFGAKVCVEGVETAEMRNILQEFNVGSFQGYYYARPLSLEELLVWNPDTFE